jgi:SAM-dependent methyltransferase
MVPGLRQRPSQVLVFNIGLNMASRVEWKVNNTISEACVKPFDRDAIDGQSYKVSDGPLDLSFLSALPSDPEPFADGRQIPWNDPGFSQRMLAYHLDESHDLASRRTEKRSRIIEALIAETGLAPGDHVLDMGCGPGLYCQELAGRGLQVSGWDFAPAAVEYARSQARAAGLDIDYVRDDYRNLNITERFKLVTLIYGDFNVFSRNDAAGLLRRIHQTLLPGGFFYTDVTTPAAHPQTEVKRDFSYHLSGLWSDGPYLELYERHPVRSDGLRWERYVIVEAPTGRARVYTTWSQEYTPQTIADLLESAGLNVHTFFDDPAASPLCDRPGWIGVLARKR